MARFRGSVKASVKGVVTSALSPVVQLTPIEGRYPATLASELAMDAGKGRGARLVRQ